MDLVVNHTSDEHPWFVESRSSTRQPQARLVLVAAAARRASSAGDAGRRADQLGLVLLRPGLGARRGARGEYYLHLFSRKQPDLNWENPEVREAVYAMMRWWLDRGVDGFRMDVINLISKDLAAARRPRRRRRAVRRRLAVLRLDGPRSTSSCQEMHREVFAGRAGAAAHRRRDARRSPSSEAAALHRPGARASSTWSSSSSTSALDQGEHQVGRAARCELRRAQGVARPLAGRAGRGRAGTASTGTTTTSRGSVSRFGDDGEHRVALGQDARPRCCTCTAARRTSTRARSSA